MSNIQKSPPMGWNSWDCYGTTVTEEQVIRNAEFMSDNLMEYGWEYVVVDIQWYEPGAEGHEYKRNAALTIDEYGRLTPAVNKFPSAANGNGFRTLSNYIHSLGLKFGIHILRGIPRQAVRKNLPIKDCGAAAAEIADLGSSCDWNEDMIGIDMTRYGAQEYYDSLFELYADWGVDFVKADDMLRPYHRAEIEAMKKAIDKSGRKIVLSLSPGDSPLKEAEHLRAYANMWRVTDDIWDSWEQIKKMTDYCRAWFPYSGDGHWPDCDMLPLGRLRLCGPLSGEHSRLTHNEQMFLMTLWCIFRSPLIMGGDLPSGDSFTLSLLTNRSLIEINQSSRGGREVCRMGGLIIWGANGANGEVYCALFNTSDTTEISDFHILFLGIESRVDAEEIWNGEKFHGISRIRTAVPAHGVRLYRLTRLKGSE